MTRSYVVDTNVVAVANNKNERVSPGCKLASIGLLASILENGRIVVDLAGEIMDEYRRYCNADGRPNVGDLFYRQLLTEYAGKVERIALPKLPSGEFVDFPTDHRLSTFDPSDRKFAVAAKVLSVPVCNAIDSDWWDHREALMDNGIQVEFVCSDDKSKWFTKN